VQVDHPVESISRLRGPLNLSGCSKAAHYQHWVVFFDTVDHGVIPHINAPKRCARARPDSVVLVEPPGGVAHHRCDDARHNLTVVNISDHG
jgi:hypothetical protein